MQSSKAKAALLLCLTTLLVFGYAFLKPKEQQNSVKNTQETSLETTNPDQAATTKLVIISPNRQNWKNEIEELIKARPDMNFTIEWINQAGASENLKLITTRFQQNPQSADIDMFIGGGVQPHVQLAEAGLLDPYHISDSLKTQIPQKIMGVSLYDDQENWHAYAISSFGIFYNKALLNIISKNLKTKTAKELEPKGWEDLADPQFFNWVSSADPRKSSSATTMIAVVLKAFGWKEGWSILTRIAANTKQFSHNSTGPITAVTSGDAALSMSIDYFAFSKIAKIGKEQLDFTFPEKHTILNADCVSILKGSKNVEAARKLVDLLLSPESQSIMLLPKGSVGGPKLSTLGRMAVNAMAYEQTEGRRINAFDPFKLNFALLSVDEVSMAKTQFILMDLMGTLIDLQKDLKEAWKVVISRGLKAEDIALLTKSPVAEEDMEKMSGMWLNQTYRNEQLNSWSEFYKSNFVKIMNLK